MSHAARFEGVRVCPDREAVCRAAALLFIELADAAIRARGRFTVALSGGDGPRRMYGLLADDPLRGRVDWKAIEFFWGEERCVAPDHPDSHFRMAREALLDKLGIDGTHIHRMPAERADLEAAARDYQQELATVFDIDAGGPAPQLDLIVRDIGEDGDGAPMPPGLPAGPGAAGPWVVAENVPALASRRMMLAPSLLARGAQHIHLVTGEANAELLAEVRERSVEAGATRVLWLADPAAAGPEPGRV